MNQSLIIGLYGISGCGKTHALNELQKRHPEWWCVEGSSVIEMVLKLDNKDHSMATFRSMDAAEKSTIRERAIEFIRHHSKGRVAIVAGHFSFPKLDNDGAVEFKNVFSQGDGQTYNCILYLNKSAAQVYSQRSGDSTSGKRNRNNMTEEQLQAWMDHETSKLPHVCKENGISFHLVAPDSGADFLEEFVHDQLVLPMVEDAKSMSHKALVSSVSKIQDADTFLLIDGDRTLWRGDTGKLFFGELAAQQKAIFQRFKAYTFEAFWTSAMLFASQPDYEQKCESLVEKLVLYGEWVQLLKGLPESAHPILVTSGVREIWAGALEKAGLRNMSVIAGNHLGRHPYIIDDKAKAIVAKELRKIHPGCHILAFGDSEIDIPMMTVSDQCFVVLDSRHNQSMKGWLEGKPIAFQLSPSSEFTSYHSGLRTATFSQLLKDLNRGVNQTIDYSRHAQSMQVLASQSRRADLHGPVLQDIHRRIGARLSQCLIDDFGSNMGLLAKASLPHVQGSFFEALEPVSKGVFILPLMRGGEPMSRGVYDTFPGAQMIHYNDNHDMSCLCSSLTGAGEGCFVNKLIIVDSVINSGNSIRKILKELVTMKAKIQQPAQIFVLSGVTQQQAAESLPREFPRVRFLTLRVSSNQYTGRGGTDTGNRLFGTV